MDQDATWYGGRPWPRRHCVRWGPNSSSPKGAQQPSPVFSTHACLLWPRSSISATAELLLNFCFPPVCPFCQTSWSLVSCPDLGDEQKPIIVLGRPFVKRFALCYRSVVCTSVCDLGVLWPNGWVDQDKTWHRGRPRPRRHCVRWNPSPPPRKKMWTAAPHFSVHVFWPNGWIDQGAT